MYFAPPLKGYLLELGTGARGQKKTTVVGLPGRERNLTIYLALWIEYTNVTGGQTDRLRATISSIVQDTVWTSYSIDLCSRDLITKSWRQRSRVATKKQYSNCFWVGRSTAAVSIKQTSVAAADCSSTSGQTWRSYVGCSWQSWCVVSDHYKPLIVADHYECRPTAGRTSMPGMVVPSGVDIWTQASIVWPRFACQQEASEGCHTKSA